jgi:hypothetical protein
VEGEKEVTTNTCDLFIAAQAWKKSFPATSASVALHDPKGKTARALKNLGIHFKTASAPTASNMDLFIVGEEAWNNDLSGAALKKFVNEGGRVLVLGQDHRAFKHDWLPAEIEMFEVSANDHDYVPKGRPSREQMHVNPERPWHPVFAGLDRYRLRLWSDYTGWDETKPGFPAVYPVTNGFKLTDANDLKHTAILANYDRGLEGVALCEMFDGKGSVILSAFDLVDRIGLDPVADRLLANLVAYAASPMDAHERRPLVEQPIVWGDYPTERGVINGPLNGLVVNAVWQRPPTEPSAIPLPDNTGAWNTDPGNSFIPRGRRPVGPFGYSTASSVRLGDSKAPGTGTFHARIPDGRTSMKTKVRNNGDAPATLNVEINGASGSPTTVQPGETITVTTPLPEGVKNEVTVRYTGAKTLVLEETAFE